MKTPEYIRLNESGNPLALPWIEQEELIWEKDGGPFGPVRTLSEYRELYKSPFDPKRYLVGVGAWFLGFSYLGNGVYICHKPKCRFLRDGHHDFSTNDETDKNTAGPNIKTVGDFITFFGIVGTQLEWTPYAISLMTGEAQQ